MKLRGYFVSPTMLQSVQTLSLCVSDASQKIENWRLKSIFNFWFSAKTLQMIDRATLEGGGGVHWHGIFLPPGPLPTVPLPSLTGKSRILLFADFRDVWERFVNVSPFRRLVLSTEGQQDLRREPRRKEVLVFITRAANVTIHIETSSSFFQARRHIVR